MSYQTDEMYFNITQVAKLINVVPATIRNWEKHGLFVANRSSNGYRIFTLNDIDNLRRIRSLSEQGMTINAIRLFISPTDMNASAQSTQPIIPKTLLGQKWKNYRISHGYSIEQVAAETNISASYIQKIENAQANNVSFDILQNLARFYGENILSYYEDHAASLSPLVKKGQGKELSIDLEGVRLNSLVGCHNNRLTAMIYTIQPGFGRMVANAHNGEEIVYMISGQIKFTLGDEPYILSTGDSLHYNSSIPHRWVNIGKADAVMIWVHTPKENSEGLIEIKDQID